MRILVSGATGFVGRHVMSRILAAGNDIVSIALDSGPGQDNYKGIKWVHGDLGDLDPVKPAIKAFNPEAVIHLAWQGIPDYSESISRNKSEQLHPVA